MRFGVLRQDTRATWVLFLSDHIETPHVDTRFVYMATVGFYHGRHTKDCQFSRRYAGEAHKERNEGINSRTEGSR